MNTYERALAYLYSFANYELSRMTPRTDMRLTRMRRLLELADNPQERFRSVLVAGTKGKGSTAAMIASIAQAAGLRTGLYSTPHLNAHRERMRIDSRLISRDEFVERMRAVRSVVARYDSELGPPTTYELGTLLAFGYFADHEVELSVVEVGLGGRLDATNVLDAEVSVIASISYDHMEVLGPTLTSIATEKAGIIKPGKVVVSAPQLPEAMAVLRQVAGERRALLLRVHEPELTQAAEPIVAGGQAPDARQCFRVSREPEAMDGQGIWLYCPNWPHFTTFCTPLLGEHQRTNAAVAIAAANELRISSEATVAGLAQVRWPGRLEILRERPLVVADGAHNVDSMEKLAAAVRGHFRYQRLRAIVGFSADKDIPGMAAVLNELADEVVLVQSKHPRSADSPAIAQHFSRARLAGDLEEALAGQGERELALVTGSLYLVGEARLHLGLVATEDQDPL
ncbi:MAG TPA: folylpolyglutamate synthase/dihydrofolate synthase family protein [Chloroflexota bacterium]|nr:folylpolyglutamate synthase/dihydrofolate synthase family protein [Chloroflexota bacterium]